VSHASLTLATFFFFFFFSACVRTARRHATCAQYLVQKGADIHRRDRSGRDALCYAAKAGAVGCSELLIRLGAKLVSDRENYDAFNIALHGKHTECSASLIRSFPQLLARIVHIGAIELYDIDVVCQTLHKYTSTGLPALKVRRPRCRAGVTLLCSTRRCVLTTRSVAGDHRGGGTAHSNCRAAAAVVKEHRDRARRRLCPRDSSASHVA
jgi:hypothetical protein